MLKHKKICSEAAIQIFTVGAHTFEDFQGLSMVMKNIFDGH